MSLAQVGDRPSCHGKQLKDHMRTVGEVLHANVLQGEWRLVKSFEPMNTGFIQESRINGLFHKVTGGARLSEPTCSMAGRLMN